MKIGQEILKRRGDLGLTQPQLAARSGVPQAHISKIETGAIKDPQFSTVEKLRRALDLAEGERLELSLAEKEIANTPAPEAAPAA